MSTTSTAIVTDGYGQFELTQVRLGDPHPGEVLVEIKTSGTTTNSKENIAGLTGMSTLD